MKINLIDDTALIETTSLKNVSKKDRTILGLRHNLGNVHEEKIKTSSRFGENCKTQESCSNMRMIRASAIGNKKRSLDVCGNVKVNQVIQENGNVGCTERVKFQENENVGFHIDGCEKKKVILGCAESLKKQETFDGNGCGEERKLMGFSERVKIQENENVGLLEFKKIQENGKGIVEESKFQENGNVGFHFDGCGKKKVILGCAESLKKQESFNGNGCEEKGKLMGFPERVKIQENVGLLEFKKIQEKVSTRNCCLSGVENICGNEKRIMGFDTNQEKNGKTVQVWVARGKVQDKYETAFKDEKVSTFEMVEVQCGNGGGKKTEGTTIRYSRRQMEDLRFVNMEDQNKKWGAIYCELGPVVKREYDGLLDCNHNHHPQLDIKKKVTAHGILGPMAANGRWNHWYLCAPKNGLK